MNGRQALCALSVVGLVACAPDAPPVVPAPPPAPVATVAVVGGLAAPPASPERPVTDDYGGLKVTDPYRWLEADGADVDAWSAAQTKRARDYLDAWPGEKKLHDRIAKLKKGSSASIGYVIARGPTLFAWKTQPPLQQPLLVTASSADGLSNGRVVVDPNRIDGTGKTTMDFYVPSNDGKLVAVSLSKGGSESGDVHVYDVATGREVGEVIPRVNGGTAGGDVSWDAAGKGFYYTRYPKKGERADEDLGFYQQVYFHKLGDKPEQDRYVIGKEFPKIAETSFSSSIDGKYTIVRMANGDGGDYAYWFAGPDGKFTQIARYEDKIESFTFGRDGKLYGLSRAGAPRGKIIRMSLAKPLVAKADVIVPESDATIRGFSPMATRLYVVDLVGGPTRVRVLDLAGKSLGEIPMPAVPSVGQVVRGNKDEVLYQVETYLEPSAWYRYDGKGAPTRTALVTTEPFDYADAEVTRETCTSKDGTKVPVSIISKKGAPRDGARPTLLTGYGGFAISLQPFFSENARVMLDVGGVFAIANLRGGGEFGESWHQAGMITKKQNVFDDFAACARRLVELHITSPEKLALFGGSNGGLLQGAVLVQHPDIARAIVSEVGIYDMMRSESFPNGAFNITEYGSVKNPIERDALFAYSPYHHVTNGTQYPAILLTTGVNDPRVAPWQSRKMTARLQASGTKEPVLLITRDTGHGIGNSLDQDIANETDLYGFVFQQLGVDPSQFEAFR